MLSLGLAGQDYPVAEPHVTGVFFYLDQDTEGLIALQPQPARQVTRKKGRFGAGSETVLTMPGAKSTVRLPSGKPAVFVFAVEPGTDPTRIAQVFQMERKGDTREILISETSGGRTMNAMSKSMLRFRISRYGKLSFKLQMEGPLIPGEYALSWTTSQTGYCFGVDDK